VDFFLKCNQNRAVGNAVFLTIVSVAYDAPGGSISATALHLTVCVFLFSHCLVTAALVERGCGDVCRYTGVLMLLECQTVLESFICRQDLH
jgi:hypothetical protein